MKNWILHKFTKLFVILTVLLSFSNANAFDWKKYYQEPLTENDKKAIVLSTVLQGVDMLQTLEIANNDNYYETNPILGKHPNEFHVITYFVARAYTLSELTKMTPKKYRAFTNIYNIVYNYDLIRHNHSIGVRINF